VNGAGGCRFKFLTVVPHSASYGDKCCLVSSTMLRRQAALKGEIESLLRQVNDLKVTTASATTTVDMDTCSGPSD